MVCLRFYKILAKAQRHKVIKQSHSNFATLRLCVMKMNQSGNYNLKSDMHNEFYKTKLSSIEL